MFKILKKIIYTASLLFFGALIYYFYAFDQEGRINKKEIKYFSDQFNYMVLTEKESCKFTKHHLRLGYTTFINLCFCAKNLEGIITKSIVIDEIDKYHISLEFDPDSNVLSIQPYSNDRPKSRRAINLADLIHKTSLIKKVGKNFELSLYEKNLVIFHPCFIKNPSCLESAIIIRHLSGKIEDNGNIKIDLLAFSLITDYFDGSYQL